MSIVVDVRNPVDVWNAGYEVLNNALGADVANAFVTFNFGGRGDFTKERHDSPDISTEKAASIIERAKAQAIAAGRAI